MNSTIIRKKRKTVKELKQLLVDANIKEEVTKDFIIKLDNRTKTHISKLNKLKKIVNSYIPIDFLLKYPQFNCINVKTRKSQIVLLRQIFNKIAINKKMSVVAIGIVIYRGNHTCCYKNLINANNYIETDPNFKELYLKILNEYNGNRVNEYPNSKQNIT